MTLVSIYSLIVFSALMGTQIWRPRLLLKYARWAYFISIVFVFLIAAYQTIQQYRIWQASGLFIKYSDWGIFQTALRYGFTNFFLNSLMALAVSVIGWLGLSFFNPRAGERFFEKPEPYVFATGLLLTGHPNWIAYAILVFSVALAYSVVSYLFTRRRDIIFSFYWF